ncbi:MAG: arginine deiminase-related protein [Fimbriimonadaceae bacterium]|jgi:hypothetical protein|nr:arginine deiminase-related protein [Fimbriimonadaceae bacterium]
MGFVASQVILVRPHTVWSNPETLATNSFQKGDSGSRSEITEKIHQEFDQVVAELKGAGLGVIVHQSQNPETPDSLFPNNWLVTLSGLIILCPMATHSRAAEVDLALVELLQASTPKAKVIDLRTHAPLEGTGSLVFDHEQKLAYACLSPRTHLSTAEILCANLGYTLVPFECLDPDGNQVYHTNVVLSIGPSGIWAAEPLLSSNSPIAESLSSSKRPLFPLSWPEIYRFAANCLELTNQNQERILVRSSAQPIATTLPYDKVIEVEIPTIEHHGGGSVRCLLAENFLSATS